VAFLFLAWLVLGGIGWAIGAALLHNLTGSAFPRRGDRAYLSLWLGIVVLASSLMAVSLVVPLSPWAGSATAAVLGAVALGQRGGRTELRRQWQGLQARRGWAIASGVFALAVAFYGVQPVTLYDTGLYHFQMLRWLAQVGTVPGLALFFYPLGYPSSWLALAAPWEAGPLAARSASVTGTLVFFLLGSQALLSGWRVCQKSGQLADWFFLWNSAIALAILAHLSLPISPSPDMGIVALSLLVPWALLLVAQQTEAATPHWRSSQLVPVLLAAGALSMKLSALLLWGFAFAVYARGNGWRWLGGGAASGLILLPSLAFGLITSGCPLYPLPVCLTSLPWSVSLDTVEAIRVSIRECARWNCPPDGSAHAPPWAWLGQWWWQQRQATFLLLSTLVALIRVAPQRVKRPRGWRTLAALGSCGSLFVLYGSPALRIGLGYFAIVPALAAASAWQQRSPLRWLALLWLVLAVNLWLQPSLTLSVVVGVAIAATVAIASLPPRWHNAGILIGALLLANAATFRTSLAVTAWRAPSLLPPPLEPTEPVVYTTRREGNFTYHLPDPNAPLNQRPEYGGVEDRCWIEPLPCTPYITLLSRHEPIRLRDPARRLRGGFERRENPPETLRDRP